MTTHQGLIELFCLYDTGHDNSARLADIPDPYPVRRGVRRGLRCGAHAGAGTMDAVLLHGDRRALSKMAAELGLERRRRPGAGAEGPGEVGMKRKNAGAAVQSGG